MADVREVLKNAQERRMMAEKKRFKQNRTFKKGLDEADDEMPAPRFNKDRRDRKPFGRDDRRGGDRKPFNRDNRDGDRRGFRDGDKREDQKPFRKDRKDGFRPRFERPDKAGRPFDRKNTRPHAGKGKFNNSNRFENPNRFEEYEDED